MKLENIRNFAIISHIDHGKSTLADRLLLLTGTISPREMRHAQILDTMDLEQERGITIKLQPVRMEFIFQGEKYILNLIDTPGHVDFAYEVSRSLAACEGVILMVDATQGIQAQTLANCYLALERNLKIIPVLNKIDLPLAEIERWAHEIEKTLDIPRAEIIPISAKEGTNIEKVLEAIVLRIPPPEVKETKETRALIFDSIYDPYRGVVVYVRVVEGEIKKGDYVTFLSTQVKVEALEVGYFKVEKFEPAEKLEAGEIGYISTGLKEVKEARVGDTVWKGLPARPVGGSARPCLADRQALGGPACRVGGPASREGKNPVSLPGYKKITPYVFASLFCVEGTDFSLLRDALEKLSLNDASLSFEPERSSALGFGFRCGFLGLLHLEIVQERLEREYDLNLIATAPSVSYQVVKKEGSEIKISNPVLFPDPSEIAAVKEPWVKIEILTPKEYLGAIMKLIQNRRGLSKSIEYLDEKRVILFYEMPLAEVIIDFYDQLKSVSSGYASLNYEFLDYRAGDLVKLDILFLGEKVEAFSTIVHRDKAYSVGSKIVKKLKDLIPRALFQIPIQAAIGSKVIARETLSALRKDVTAKLYGGDRTRKDKLLKKQKAGKKRLKMMGKVAVPKEAFLAVIKR